MANNDMKVNRLGRDYFRDSHAGLIIHDDIMVEPTSAAHASIGPNATPGL